MGSSDFIQRQLSSVLYPESVTFLRTCENVSVLKNLVFGSKKKFKEIAKSKLLYVHLSAYKT